MVVYKVSEVENKIEIAKEIVLADTFWLRLKGLLGRNSIDPEEGVILYPCSQIHCIGMKFPIDVVFMDKDKKVVGVYTNVLPGKIASAKNAKYALELKSGIVERKQIKPGDRLEF